MLISQCKIRLHATHVNGTPSRPLSFVYFFYISLGKAWSVVNASGAYSPGSHKQQHLTRLIRSIPDIAKM